jgi:hypothetical protein
VLFVGVARVENHHWIRAHVGKETRLEQAASGTVTMR